MKQTAEMRMVPISMLKTADYNPRRKLNAHNRQYRELKKSIEELGFAESIVVNSDMTVVGGHQRISAAAELGYTELPCTIVHLDKKKEKALNIALNKITGIWDEEKLAELITELDDEMFDLSAIGFDAAEVDDLFNQVYSCGVRREKRTWAIPEGDEIISRPGDLWQLGSHRILCGDATDWQSYHTILGSQKADLVCIDSPYFVNFRNRVTGTILNDNLPLSEASFFLRRTFSHLYRCMKNDASIYVFYASTRSNLFFSEFDRAGFHVGAVPVWVKGKAPLSKSDFNFKYEPIIYGWKQKGTHHWYGSGSDTTVLEFGSVHSSAEDGFGHPSSKPVQLIAYLIRLSSRQKGIVVDSFLGSGTTLIACEQLNRQCFGIEIEPKFIDICVRRYIAFRETCDDVFLIRKGKRYSWNQALELTGKEKS